MYRQTQQCGKGRGMVGGGALAFLVAGLLAGQACPTSQPPRAEDVARSAAGDPEGKQEARVDFHGDPLPAGAVARFGTVRMRHHDGITGVALSPDGKILATVGEHRDHEHLALACLGLACPIRLWDTATGKELGQLSGHSCLPRGLAFSPDGKILASLVAWPIPAGEDSVRLWDVVSRKPLHRLQGSQLPQPEESGCNYRYGLVFSPDGKLLAAVGRDGHLRLWDVASGKLVRKWFDEA
ncbi:MAG TPA: hypothetical protein VEL76_40240, partial [Gemmataceae bacterium]|nr:hypothetical protein [Gemmataceae bacterium]